MLIEETDRGSRALDQLKAMKVKIAIDDFGTGYSSLSYLKRFPVDTIKIDKSFVAEMETSATSAALVKAVVDLAHNLGVATVAEGVENADQKAKIQDLGCTYGQGYLFARPLTAGQIEEKLDAARQSAKARRHAPLDVDVIESIDRPRQGRAPDRCTAHRPRHAGHGPDPLDGDVGRGLRRVDADDGARA